MESTYKDGTLRSTAIYKNDESQTWKLYDKEGKVSLDSGAF